MCGHWLFYVNFKFLPVLVTTKKKSPTRPKGQAVDNTTMIIKVAGQEYCVTNRTKKRHSKSHSLGSISDFCLEIETTKIDKDFYTHSNNNNSVKFDGEPESQETNDKSNTNHCDNAEQQQNFNLSKSKSEGNPFHHRKQGKIIKIAQRATTSRGKNTSSMSCRSFFFF